MLGWAMQLKAGLDFKAYVFSMILKLRFVFLKSLVSLEATADGGVLPLAMFVLFMRK